MSNVITVLGGNGFVGSQCINYLVKNVQNVKVFAVSRSGVMRHPIDNREGRVEMIKGDCLNPSTFEDVIKKSTGIIHAIGVLFTNNNEKYHMMNKETCLRVAKIANESQKSEADRTNLVYISAQRGIPFPLSLKYHGYIEAKRECEEKLLENFPNLNPVILRPGFVKSKEKMWTVPLYHFLNENAEIEKIVFNKINPKLGEKLQWPSKGIEIEKLTNFAVAGALGKLKAKEIYSNDYMIDKNNKINLH